MSKRGKGEPLRVGVVGLGMGRGHVRAFKKHPRCRVEAVCDLDRRRLAEHAEAEGVPHTFDDATAMFASGLVDAVSIATPNFTHHPLTMAALKAGLHVLCEKPLALHAKQAKAMTDAAKRRGLKLAVNYSHRRAAPFQAMHRAVAAGLLGDIYFARGVWHRRKGIPVGAEGWFFSKEKSGGGCMIDLGVHMLDLCLYMMDYPQPAAVTGHIHNHFAGDVGGQPMDVEDFATGYFRFANGAAVELEISWAGYHERVEERIVALYGTRGGATVRIPQGQDPQVTIHRRENGDLTDTRVTRIDVPPITVMEDFVDAVLDDRPPACSGDHGLTGMRCLDAFYKSAASGKEVRIPG